MEHYLLVKNIHIATAVLSLVGFCIRGWWMFNENELLQNKFVKIFPHINDTILLSCAIYLSIISTLYPFMVGWLGAKVLLLIGYILAGTIALKRGKTRQVRAISFILAIFCVGTIFLLAIFKP
ncbi:MAG: invasion protein [Gammaproteobacteria bacterium]|nr:MAG: invasion protein [Gammaproteobacteria bacterium]